MTPVAAPSHARRRRSSDRDATVVVTAAARSRFRPAWRPIQAASAAVEDCRGRRLVELVVDTGAGTASEAVERPWSERARVAACGQQRDLPSIRRRPNPIAPRLSWRPSSWRLVVWSSERRPAGSRCGTIPNPAEAERRWMAPPSGKKDSRRRASGSRASEKDAQGRPEAFFDRSASSAPGSAYIHLCLNTPAHAFHVRHPAHRPPSLLSAVFRPKPVRGRHAEPVSGAGRLIGASSSRARGCLDGAGWRTVFCTCRLTAGTDTST